MMGKSSPPLLESNAHIRLHEILSLSVLSSSCVPKGSVQNKDATYWKEIHAAMALTNLAQSEEGGTAGTTSRIIQKSSHIAEIKTVKVPIHPRH